MNRRSAVAAGLVLVVLVAAGAGCHRTEREAAVIRLLDLAPLAESSWPRDRPRDVPETIDGLRSWRQVRKQRVGRVSMFPEDGGDNRRALVAPLGTVHRFAVELPDDALLRAGLGYVPMPDSEGVEVRFEIRLAVVATGAEQTVLEESIITRADGGWREVAVDLGRWSGKAVQLSLSVEAGDSERPIWAAWSAPEIVSRGLSQSGPDVILIVLDTLRADRLGCYGYPFDTSPNLDRFAAGAVRFERAVSQAPWTYPSHRSLFSGLFPTARGLDEAPKLAEVLNEAGYRTEAVTGGGQMDFRMGFAEGFDTYRLFDWIRNPDWLGAWLESSSHRRRFLFLHTYEIHDPYVHAEFVEGRDGGRIRVGFGRNKFWGLRKPVTDEEKDYVSGLYDGGIAYTDRQLGLLFERLAETGALDRSIVIVTSDHGEQFWEHGSWRHGMNLYDEQLLVPLIVRLPKSLEASLGSGAAASRVVARQVRLVDLYPTLLDLLEIPASNPLHGRSLEPLFQGADLPPIDAFAERLNLENRDSKALRTERYKFIYSFPKARGVELGVEEYRELYDLAADPGEQVNLAERYPQQVTELEERLEALTQWLDDPLLLHEGTRKLDPDLEQRLRALGYLGD
jgi:arylsulfatase A-like enzyme